MQTNGAKVQRMGVGRYFWRWIKEAFRLSWGVAETVTGAVCVGLGAAVHYWSDIEPDGNGLLLQLPLWALGGVAAYRLIAAPYRLAKKDNERTAELEAAEAARQQTEQSQQTLASLIEEGRAFFRQRLTTADEYAVWKAEMDGWLQRSADAVSHHFSGAKARLYLVAPTISAASWGGAFSETHNMALSKLDIYLKRLTEMAN
jgi:hypothetical protein